MGVELESHLIAKAIKQGRPVPSLRAFWLECAAWVGLMVLAGGMVCGVLWGVGRLG